MLIGIAGDWHGSSGWAQTSIPRLKRAGAEEIWHLGDLQLGMRPSPEKYVDTLNYWLRITGLELFLVEGNHEGYNWIEKLPQAAPNELNITGVRSVEHIHVVPRGHIFERPGCAEPFYGIAFGGAASINVKDLVPGVNWFPQERITEEQVEATLAHLAQLRRRGVAPSVMLTHEAPQGIPALDAISAQGGWSPGEVAYADESRSRLQRVFEEVAPQLHFHGHWHTHIDEELLFNTRNSSFTTRIIGTTEEHTAHNLWLLDTETYQVSAVPRFS
jgi:hypothetical protein